MPARFKLSNWPLKKGSELNFLFEKYTGQKANRIAEYGETVLIMVSFMTQRADATQFNSLETLLKNQTESCLCRCSLSRRLNLRI